MPRRVDPSTGYRSYGTDQVGRARLIAALRGLGMGLARIRVLCDLDGAAAATEPRSWWRQEEADALSRAVAVRDLASSLGQHPTEDAMTTTTTPARSASAPHIGLERTAQEDAVLVRALPGDRTLLAAADGFHDAGDLAARMLSAFAGALERALAAPSASPAAGPRDRLDRRRGAGADTGCRRLDPHRRRARRRSPAHRPPRRHARDARARRPARARHAGPHPRALPARGGPALPEEAASHPDRRVLNRALATGAPSAPDLLVRHLEPGDLVIVASDGAHAVADPSALAEALGGEQEPEALARHLIDLALDAGGPDNVAVALARA
uniref:MerR family transcriptional regulator n=1 Tax=Brachybacterium sp. GPGPB12 TaxID=3023517 RepID=UPI00404B7E94